MADFLDTFMTYGAVLAMLILLASLLVALVRGMKSANGRASPPPEQADIRSVTPTGAGEQSRNDAGDDLRG